MSAMNTDPASSVEAQISNLETQSPQQHIQKWLSAPELEALPQDTMSTSFASSMATSMSELPGPAAEILNKATRKQKILAKMSKVRKQGGRAGKAVLSAVLDDSDLDTDSDTGFTSEIGKSILDASSYLEANKEYFKEFLNASEQEKQPEELPQKQAASTVDSHPNQQSSPSTVSSGSFPIILVLVILLQVVFVLYFSLWFLVSINLPLHLTLMAAIGIPVLAHNQMCTAKKGSRDQTDQETNAYVGLIGAVIGGQLLSSFYTTGEQSMSNAVLTTLVAAFLYLPGKLQGRDSYFALNKEMGPILGPLFIVAFVYGRTLGNIIFSVFITLYGALLGYWLMLGCAYLFKRHAGQNCFEFSNHNLLVVFVGGLFGDVTMSVLSQALKPEMNVLFCMSGGILVGLVYAKIFEEVYIPWIKWLAQPYFSSCGLVPEHIFAGGVIGCVSGFLMVTLPNHPVVGAMLGFAVLPASPYLKEYVSSLVSKALIPPDASTEPQQTHSPNVPMAETNYNKLSSEESTEAEEPSVKRSQKVSEIFDGFKNTTYTDSD